MNTILNVLRGVSYAYRTRWSLNRNEAWRNHEATGNPVRSDAVATFLRNAIRERVRASQPSQPLSAWRRSHCPHSIVSLDSFQQQDAGVPLERSAAPLRVGHLVVFYDLFFLAGSAQSRFADNVMYYVRIAALARASSSALRQAHAPLFPPISSCFTFMYMHFRRPFS